jgi:hypothetical protein
MNDDSRIHHLASTLMLSSAFRDCRDYENTRGPFSNSPKTTPFKQGCPENRAICMARPLLLLVIDP